MERLDLFIQKQYFVIHSNRHADTGIHKVFNSIILKEMLKSNVWEGVDTLTLKIWLNGWFCFGPVFLQFGLIVWVHKPVYQCLGYNLNIKYISAWFHKFDQINLTCINGNPWTVDWFNCSHYFLFLMSNIFLKLVFQSIFLSFFASFSVIFC